MTIGECFCSIGESFRPLRWRNAEEFADASQHARETQLRQALNQKGKLVSGGYTCIAAMLCIAIGTAATAAGGDDPDWPCIQRRAPHLSPAVMWPGAEEGAAALTPDLEDLGSVLALRRVSLADAQARIDSFGDRETGAWKAVFLETFGTLERRRARVMDGITRFARNQTALAGRIETLRQEMRAAEAAETPDFDRIDALEEELDWSLRVFDDRRRTLTYVCETPKVIEQRIYAVAQLLKARAGE